MRTDIPFPLNPAGDPGPARLSAETRRLAAEYLAGTFRSRLGCAEKTLSVDGGDSPLLRAQGAKMLAEIAPLEIIPEERLAGSEPFIEATWHCVPGLTRNGGSDHVGSISHTTVDFGDAVRKGLRGLEAEIRERRTSAADQGERDFCDALLMTLDAIRIWTGRYLSAYREMLESPEYADEVKTNFRKIVRSLERVPENPPETFAEAIQSFWTFFEFERLCGNWSGLGRFDEILGPWLTRDLENGTISLDEARELVAHFWIKGTEWCFGLREGNSLKPGSGDAQNYQNIILGGMTVDGSQAENELTYLVLDVIEELHISDYPVAVRISRRTPEKLLRRIADVQLLGGGIVSVYNEDVVMDGLRRLGFPEDEVRAYTNDGCWEVIIPGKTNFGYCPFDVLKCFQNALFAEKTPETAEELYAKYLENLRGAVEWIQNNSVIPRHYRKTANADGTVSFESWKGCDVTLSLLEPSCRESAHSYQDLGTKYAIVGIHAGGLPDVANSMRAIEEFVVRRKKLTLPQLVEILRNDWEGHEPLRQEIRHSILYYGNDDDDADAVMLKCYNDFAAVVGRRRSFKRILMPAGISTFGREIQFASDRLATAFGARAHEYLAPNLSPTPGTDRNPVTSVLSSYCKMDLTQTPNGCPLDLRLTAGLRGRKDAPELLAGLLRTFIEKGGWYLQIDAVDPDMLRQAQLEPDRFPNLVVRISGWSARFASLSREWQDMIIRRTALGL